VEGICVSTNRILVCQHNETEGFEGSEVPRQSCGKLKEFHAKKRYHLLKRRDIAATSGQFTTLLRTPKVNNAVSLRRARVRTSLSMKLVFAD
jgi:hypothetical protein